MTLYEWYALRFGHGISAAIYFRPDGCCPYVRYGFRDRYGEELVPMTALTLPA